jgi:hypothetical protein
MRTTVLLAFVGMLLTEIAVAGAVVRHGSIPNSYIGSWTRETCRARSKAIIKLSATRYVSSGMKCIVRGVYETAGAHGSIYSARMQCSRAGRSRGTSANLIIDPGGGDRVLMGSDFSNLTSYRRCQSNKRTDLR